MNKLMIAVIGVMFAAGTAMAADSPQQEQKQPDAQARATSYWLHPKLGMVKVDRATGFMVISGKAQQPQAALQQPKPGHDHARTHKLM